MIRLIACLLLATGLTSMVLGGGRLAREHFAPPVAEQTYVADPRGTTYHCAEPRCLFVDPAKVDAGAMLTYKGESAARDSGRTPCPHCVKGR